MKTKRHGSVQCSQHSACCLCGRQNEDLEASVRAHNDYIHDSNFFFKKKTSANTICTSDRASEDWVSSTNTVQVVLMRKAEAQTNVP